MKYYRIKRDLTNMKIVGTFPQIETAIYDCDPFEDENFIDNLGFKRIKIKPKLAIGKLHKKAKLTDFLSVVPMGFSNKLLVSTKLKDILISKNNTNVQVFNNPILVDNLTNTDYWLVNPVKLSNNIIDFQKSDIFLKSGIFLDDKIKKLKIITLEEYIIEEKKIEEMGGFPFNLFFEKIRIDDNTEESFFVLNNVYGGYGYYISEKLKNEIENQKLTGIQFEEL
ncbi:hypothetical protein [Tenacibaculum finnmarkense]|uniref:hypothetical protein n=1 Tax=Tenacibaculum finnmarkense TaxID=2781243 RepID=UPI000C7D7031|nr:hypothetical protein [Tenacibaculum finnmarkense]MCD8439772.1 hypothetical protein [Tenacibaculum finnmarkense genomovar ulcerans]MCG8720620.1 hypothetical protein [Tenacibaculum finnmarkense]